MVNDICNVLTEADIMSKHEAYSKQGLMYMFVSVCMHKREIEREGGRERVNEKEVGRLVIPLFQFWLQNRRFHLGNVLE